MCSVIYGAVCRTMYIFTIMSVMFGVTLLETQGLALNSSSQNSPIILCNYIYFRDTEGWFKLHARPAKWHDAQAVCHSEGTSLLYPATINLTDIAIYLMKSFSISTIHTSMTLATKQPGKQKCITLKQERSVQKAKLDDSFPFICHTDKVESILLNKCGTVDKETQGLPLNSSSENSPRFRCDYTFFRDAEGWFKLHERPAKWHDAQAVCHSEGASLLYPSNKVLVNTTVHLMRNFSISTIHTSMTVPTKQPEKQKCITFNQKSSMQRAEFDDSFPFICHMYKLQPILLNECGTVDKDYQFYNVTGHCYKLHKNKANWFKAEATCKAEGGQLAIINSQTEAEVIIDIFKNNPADQIRDFKFGKDVAFIGFRSLDKGRSWTTINGETLSKAGYAEFNPGEPNNAAGDEYCGSVRRNGTLLDDPCQRELLFICEKTDEMNCDENNAYQ